MTRERYDGFLRDIYRDCLDLRRAMTGHMLPMGDTFLGELFKMMPATTDVTAVDHDTLHHIALSFSVMRHVNPIVLLCLPPDACDALNGILSSIKRLGEEVAQERLERERTALEMAVAA